MGNTLQQQRRSWTPLASLALCILLAIGSEWGKFHFVYGITMSLTGLFVLLALRLFGLWNGLLCAVLAYGAGAAWMEHSWFTLIGIAETAFVGLLLHRYNGKLLGSSAFFWLVCGIPATYALHLHDSSIGQSGALLIAFIIATNGIINALFAEIIHQYVPLSRWSGLSSLKRLPFSTGRLLLHFAYGITALSFVLNVVVSNLGSLNEIEKHVLRISEQIASHLTGALQTDETNGAGFSGMETAVAGYRSDRYAVSVADRWHVITASNREDLIGESLNTGDKRAFKPLTDSLYLSVPDHSRSRFALYTWDYERFVYAQDIPNTESRLLVTIPINLYKNYLFSKYWTQFYFLAGFSLLATAFAVLLNRSLVRSLQRLAVTTRNLPLKLKQNNALELPQSSIVEIHSLIANFKHMAGSLLYFFQELRKSNERLQAQAQLLQQSEERLHQLAYYDALTEMPNRPQFTLHFQQLIQMAGSESHPIAVLFTDINRFKQVNDTLGHTVGDQLLRLAGERFSALSNRYCTVYRLGGDEFVFLCSFKDELHLKEIAQSICDSFAQPFVIDGKTIFLTLSVGISVYPHDGNDMDTIIRNADMAMYNAKEEGDGCYRFFRPSLVSAITEKMQLENGLYEALKSNQFSLHYQPKIKAATGELCGIEALIRWHHPELGMVPPDKFIPLAEQSGFILEIDSWVFREACRQNKAWQDAGLKRISVSVNISARHFYQGNLKEMIVNGLRETGLEPQYVSLEITEGVFMRNLEQVIETILYLRGLGIQISIDDFGTGYSSLNQLQRLPISDVKLDRSFIRGITNDEKKSSIVKAIIELVHSMNMKVVAEGVETQDESQFCKELKCDELQGYLFSRPLPPDQLKELLIHF